MSFIFIPVSSDKRIPQFKNKVIIAKSLIELSWFPCDFGLGSFVEFKSQAIDLGKIENDYEEFILFEIPHSPKLTFNKRSKPNLNNISTFILEWLYYLTL